MREETKEKTHSLLVTKRVAPYGKGEGSRRVEVAGGEASAEERRGEGKSTVSTCTHPPPRLVSMRTK
jgi:hypothetical protein